MSIWRVVVISLWRRFAVLFCCKILAVNWTSRESGEACCNNRWSSSREVAPEESDEMFAARPEKNLPTNGSRVACVSFVRSFACDRRFRAKSHTCRRGFPSAQFLCSPLLFVGCPRPLCVALLCLTLLTGHTVEFCRDQHGSRFIQQKLEVSSDADKEAFFDEILPHTPRLGDRLFPAILHFVCHRRLSFLGVVDASSVTAKHVTHRGFALLLSLQ